jgi:hypothetical protein
MPGTVFAVPFRGVFHAPLEPRSPEHRAAFSASLQRSPRARAQRGRPISLTARAVACWSRSMANTSRRRLLVLPINLQDLDDEDGCSVMYTVGEGDDSALLSPIEDIPTGDYITFDLDDLVTLRVLHLDEDGWSPKRIDLRREG